MNCNDLYMGFVDEAGNRVNQGTLVISERVSLIVRGMFELPSGYLT